MPSRPARRSHNRAEPHQAGHHVTTKQCAIERMVAVKQSHIEQQSSIELYLKSWVISMCATLSSSELCSNQ